jgi:chemotaxis protein methyltransferase CheR
MPETVATGSGARKATRAITQREFERIRRLAYEKFGLDLKNGKQDLVSARLGKKIRDGNFRSFEEYYQHVVSDETGEALISMIDALTTNFTSFLREPAHFEFLAKKVLPGLRNRDQVNIWSAACSTGEEPYTLAFSLLDDLAMVPRPRIHILATDISTKALETARNAVYPAERFAGFPPSWLPKFLLRGHGRWEGWYRVKPQVLSLFEFRRLNLIEPFSHPSPFALIFCRNVMIYFDKPTQEVLVNRLAEWLEPGGVCALNEESAVENAVKGILTS